MERSKTTWQSVFSVPVPGESKGAEKHPLPVADTGGFSAPQPRKQKTGFNACLLFATAARREQALLAVSIREVRRRGRKRNLPLLRVVSFVPFLWTSKEKGTAQGMTCKHTKANAQKGAVSKLRVILSIAKNLVPEVQKNLEGKDPSSLRSSG